MLGHRGSRLRAAKSMNHSRDIVDVRARFEVLEVGGRRRARAPKHPGAADPVGHVLDGGALRPIKSRHLAGAMVSAASSSNRSGASAVVGQPGRSIAPRALSSWHCHGSQRTGGASRSQSPATRHQPHVLRTTSSHSHQGREMRVTMTGEQDLDAARSGSHGVGERR